jgi:hypothetical protein
VIALWVAVALADEPVPIEVPADEAADVEAPVATSADVEAPPVRAEDRAVDVPPPGGRPAPPVVGAVPRQVIALGASGGYDLATRQPYASLDLAFHNGGTAGFAFVGRVQAGWGFTDMRPLAHVEAGFSAVIQGKQLVRVGGVVGTALFAAPYPAPLQVPGPPGEGDYAALSFLPYGTVLAEVGGTRPGHSKGWASWAAGLRLGAGATIASSDVCGDVELGTCGDLRVGFAGGVTGRLRFHEGAYLEALAGPTSYLMVGYAF